jgi:hypothetical protein
MEMVNPIGKKKLPMELRMLSPDLPAKSERDRGTRIRQKLRDNASTENHENVNNIEVNAVMEDVVVTEPRELLEQMNPVERYNLCA